MIHTTLCMAHSMVHSAILFLSICWLSTATAECPPRNVFLTTAACYGVYSWNVNETEFTARLPIGFSTVHAGLESNPCTFNITVEVDSSSYYDPCGQGECETEYPFACRCPPGTEGEYCCESSAVTGDPCLSGGTCALTGICECLAGYAGEWCCPIADFQNNACGYHGCCLSDGTCECNDGYSGDACEIYNFDRVSEYHRQWSGGVAIGVFLFVVLFACIWCLLLAWDDSDYQRVPSNPRPAHEP